MGGLLCAAIQIYIIVVFASVVLSWFPHQHGGALEGIYQFTRMLTDPVMEPVRRALPRTGMLDFSPFIVILVLTILQSVLC